MSSKKEEEVDPSIYQYDQVYDQIKGARQNKRSRSRSRDKQKKRQPERPKHSKYIAKMKQIVQDRQKDHEYAREKVIRKENERLGVNEEMVFVTDSYLKKKEEEKQAARRKAEQEDKNAKMQVQKGSYVDFKKQMLEHRLQLTKK